MPVKEPKAKTLECMVCGYRWESRLPKPPKQCPRCKRYDYNGRVWSGK
jgi:rubrerythrin